MDVAAVTHPRGLLGLGQALTFGQADSMAGGPGKVVCDVGWATTAVWAPGAGVWLTSNLHPCWISLWGGTALFCDLLGPRPGINWVRAPPGAQKNPEALAGQCFTWGHG